MKEKEFNHPETKSFDEQYGKLMQEELQRRREEQEARERAWAEEAAAENKYEEDSAFDDSSNADYDVSETFSKDEIETTLEDGFEPTSQEEVSKFLDEDGNVDFSAIIEAEDLEEGPKEDPVEEGYEERFEDEAFEEPNREDSFENNYQEESAPEDEYPQDAETEEGDDDGGEKPPTFLDEKTLRRRRKRKIRRIGRLSVTILIVLALVLVLIANTPLFAIKKIEVKGAHVHSKQYVVRNSGIKIGDNMFRIKSGKAAKNLEKSPYIYSAKVKRVLPDTLEIQVTERVPVAYLPYGSKYIVIDKRGTVIKVRNSRPSLTKLEGFRITDRTVGSKIGVKNQSKLDDCMDILRAMKANNIFFKKLEPGDVVMRAYVYDRLVCRATKKNLEKSIKDGTLAQVLQDLYKKKTRKGTIHIGAENYISYSPKVSK